MAWYCEKGQIPKQLLIWKIYENIIMKSQFCFMQLHWCQVSVINSKECPEVTKGLRDYLLGAGDCLWTSCRIVWLKLQFAVHHF